MRPDMVGHASQTIIGRHRYQRSAANLFEGNRAEAVDVKSRRIAAVHVRNETKELILRVGRERWAGRCRVYRATVACCVQPLRRTGLGCDLRESHSAIQPNN